MTDRSLPPDVEVTDRNVEARVKWFNPLKGFGFVQTGPNAPDAFLHVSVLQDVGQSDLTEGAVITCDLGRGRKGFQVLAVHSVSQATGTAGEASESGTQEVTGHVKFFNGDKGFGFVMPEDGGPDIFVSARVLHKANLRGLDADQAVRIQVRNGPKGPMAINLELI